MQRLAKLGWALAQAAALNAYAAPPEEPGGGPGADARVFALPAPLAVASARARGLAAGLGAPLEDGRLAGLRGGSDTPWSDMKLNGAVSGNSAVAVATGANVITEGAFSNASGLPMVIQNSGANVLIQNATIVNVQFK
ncbi:hypothetical protein LJR289_002413 [Pseudoduganella sp. LjRoot289]|uniref:hypothetical protein n=1 Tax=Pseudoduganella sp. LjRoot289 TaxID=3342314 RepID=UPI003ECCCFD7